MVTTKRVSSKQKLDTLVERIDSLLKIEEGNAKKVSELINSMKILGSKLDKMVILLEKAGEVDVFPRPEENQQDSKEIKFSDL